VSTTWAAEPGLVRVTVEDTGVGMTDEVLSRAFDPFYTTKPQGTGLGMSVARSVVDLHGGTFSVQSRAGAGTRIEIVLPVVQ
jgi:signal transduction histidine kinase